MIFQLTSDPSLPAAALAADMNWSILTLHENIPTVIIGYAFYVCAGGAASVPLPSSSSGSLLSGGIRYVRLWTERTSRQTPLKHSERIFPPTYV